MFGKILLSLIALVIIGAVAYVALVDIDVPQKDVVVEINTNAQ